MAKYYTDEMVEDGLYDLVDTFYDYIEATIKTKGDTLAMDDVYDMLGLAINKSLEDFGIIERVLH